MPRTPEYDRSVVVDRAMAVFWTRGYSQTSICHLVKATGLKPGSHCGQQPVTQVSRAVLKTSHNRVWHTTMRQQVTARRNIAPLRLTPFSQHVGTGMNSCSALYVYGQYLTELHMRVLGADLSDGCLGAHALGHQVQCLWAQRRVRHVLGGDRSDTGAGVGAARGHSR